MTERKPLPIHATLPLSAPPHSLPPRPLPATRQHVPGLPHWHLATHAFPAAYPRSKAGCSKLASEPSQGVRGKVAKEDVNPLVDTILARQAAAEVQTRTDVQEQPLFMAVNRYWTSLIPKGSRTPVTLLFAHANGLHKEVSLSMPKTMGCKLSALGEDLGANLGCYRSEIRVQLDLRRGSLVF